MKISRILTAALLSLVVAFALGCATPQHAGDHAAHSAQAGAGARTDVIYFCDCGPECECKTVATAHLPAILRLI